MDPSNSHLCIFLVGSLEVFQRRIAEIETYFSAYIVLVTVINSTYQVLISSQHNDNFSDVKFEMDLGHIAHKT